MKIHTQEYVQFCYYFNNNRVCPFEEQGCKFLHEVSKVCKFSNKCAKRLCPHRHDEELHDKINDSEIQMDEEDINDNDENENSVNEFNSFVTSTPQKKTV